MTFLTAEYPWATFLEQMVDGLAKQLHQRNPALADIDIHGDPAVGLLSAELGDVVADRRDVVWTVANVLSVLWIDWLEHHAVDAVIDIGGLRVHAPCEVMMHLAYGSMSRPAWFAASTPTIGPATP
jgi:hypothetical protein